MKNLPAHHQKESEPLAARRILSAWIRTTMAMLSLEFVVSKFGLWLGELDADMDPQRPMHDGGTTPDRRGDDGVCRVDFHSDRVASPLRWPGSRRRRGRARWNPCADDLLYKTL